MHFVRFRIFYKGRRIAALLRFAYCDKELVSAIARERDLGGSYVQGFVGKGAGNDPVTVGRTFSYPAYLQQSAINILLAQQKAVMPLLKRGAIICASIQPALKSRQHRTI